MNNVNIVLKDAYVNGVDTAARSQTFKNWFVNRKSMFSTKIPILNNISFSAKPGDKVAIIGRNGSGKSSLLKAISGIYPIESGFRRVKGSIAPLIEMGLGFNPDLPGKDNIKLSFAYRGKLNLYSEELAEQIIEFSELGDKIYQPFKSYSSGMQTRLSFSSVIFQSPDILLLDEVLAVGDVGFVKKSQKIIKEKFLTSSISILVNHSFEDIEDMCNRFILMDEGRIIMEDSPKNIMKKYRTDILKGNLSALTKKTNNRKRS